MALHPHVEEFYTEWLQKADSYGNETTSDLFNKAFSLFTLYNKLYVEATFELARNNVITLNENRGFPDRKGATEYAPRFIGHQRLLQVFSESNQCSTAIERLLSAIDNHEFYIKLSMLRGERQPEKDATLATRMRSNGIKTKVEAILDLIYSVRCNMFHGNKRYSNVQTELLRPVTTLLRAVVVELYTQLNQ
ncbi:hypothetical protein [Vibrio hepatarius]|uniref:hypothetical protein n=1 Tax=Vibrio hepatarius TaxID=171383 RepID=UPI003736F936